MPRYFLLISLLTFIHAYNASAQIAKDFLVGGSFDLVKTDNDNFAKKAQFGLEANYFLTTPIAVSSGFEIWTGEGLSFVLGARWYPVQEAFLRFRGLVGENDLSLGGGWTKPLKENMKFEAIADFYFKGEFAIRVGLVHVINRKTKL